MVYYKYKKEKLESKFSESKVFLIKIKECLKRNPDGTDDIIEEAMISYFNSFCEFIIDMCETYLVTTENYIPNKSGPEIIELSSDFGFISKQDSKKLQSIVKIRNRYTHDYYQRKLYYEIEFYEYVQFVFLKQWNRLKEYAHQNGVQIIGDIPIYVAYDSADTWANPELFQLDEENLPSAVAGCPPDGFAADGQLWGNPLYRWEYHRQTGYAWWVSRLAYCYQLYDMVRIDHFRGFDEYFSIPYGDKTAHNGHWEKGPGIELFWRVKECLGEKEVIAEDLGYVTDSVRQLVRDTGYPGMKVLEFAFDSRDTGSANDYLPHNYPKNSVVYTGTHDNETLTGWFEGILPQERQMVRNYLNNHRDSDKEIYWDMVCTAMQSVSKLCVIPIQDYLGYGNEARMNQPSTLGENWKWRLKKGELSEELIQKIKNITMWYGRYYG